MRKLASIQKIERIVPIPSADKIVVAIMEDLDWECVVKKDEFQVGDIVVYFEVDSILPEREDFEFLRERKFRIKTIKLRQQISQGLIMPISILPSDRNYKVGEDVTDILGVIKYDPQLNEEGFLSDFSKKKHPPKWMMKIKPFRKLYFYINPKQKGNFPSWIDKTDEIRIQVCAKILLEHFDDEWEITEKLDGQSATYFVHNSGRFFNKHKFGVCSRNVWLKSFSHNNYWYIAKKYDLRNQMLGLRKTREFVDNLVFQGEIVGPGVQKNRYDFTDYEFYIFNIIVDGIKLNHSSSSSFLFRNFGEEISEFNPLFETVKLVKGSKISSLSMVPLLDNSFIPSRYFNGETDRHRMVQMMLDLSMGKAEIRASMRNQQREGIVVRLKKYPNISFKVINPNYLLEE